MATARRILIALCKALPIIAVIALVTASAAAQTTQQAGTPTVTTEQMSGEVVRVEGNNLAVKMANGELRTFSNIPDSRRATIDGKEVGVSDLKPGTRLTATITKTTTPITVRTVTVGTGTVWLVMAPNVILTLPNGENKQYTVKPDYKFIVNGQPRTVNELRPGMRVTAEKIVEEPKVEIATDTKVVGQAPAAPAPEPVTRAPAQQAAAAPAPQSAAAPAPQSAPAAPRTLPKTASSWPLLMLVSAVCLAMALALTLRRRFGH